MPFSDMHVTSVDRHVDAVTVYYRGDVLCNGTAPWHSGVHIRYRVSIGLLPAVGRCGHLDYPPATLSRAVDAFRTAPPTRDSVPIA
jgi:hypothetical protein